jgi:hypothetical protein
MSYKVIAVASTLFLFATNGFCQTFTDNFDRENLFDGNPVQWEEINPGNQNIVSITDGNLIVSDVDVSGGEDPVLAVQGAWKVVTIQTQFGAQTLGNGTFAGIFGRAQPVPSGQFYGAIIRDNGVLTIFEGLEDQTNEVLASMESGLDQSSFEGDVVLQLAFLGDTITASAWETGSPSNITELSIVDDSITFGGAVGLTVGGGGTVSFRSFSVVPEPSCSALLLVGMISLAGLSRSKAGLSLV